MSNKLKNSYTDHGYGAIKGYDGHARMFDTFGSVDGTNLEPSRVIHELQFNSARFKANELRSASEIANINNKISQLRQRLNEPGLSNDEKQLIVDQITALRNVGVAKINILIGHRMKEISDLAGNGEKYDVEIEEVEIIKENIIFKIPKKLN